MVQIFACPIFAHLQKICLKYAEISTKLTCSKKTIRKLMILNNDFCARRNYSFDLSREL